MTLALSFRGGPQRRTRNLEGSTEYLSGHRLRSLRGRCGMTSVFGTLIVTAICLGPALAREVPMKLKNAHVVPLDFADLRGWADDDHAAAYASFLNSCRAILNGSKAMRAARPVYGGLYRVCRRAHKAGRLDEKAARAFFEDNFKPMQISSAGQDQGFFTGYYETEVEGSLAKTDEFKYPFYRKPPNLNMPKNGRGRPARRVGKKLVPYYDRAEIEDGALAGKGLEICWTKDPIDVFFAQIQGSTRVKLTNGKQLRLNYIAHNGLPYTPVGRYLIDAGIIAREDMSMDRIRAWMEANPDKGKELRRTNRSYVFFERTDLSPHEQIEGAQGVPLTPMRSAAVDKSIHVYGTPIWVDADLPLLSETPETPFRRLLIAQDTGSAIVGPARADIFFGAGEEVGHVAGRIKQHGQFVMLVPKSVHLTGDSAGAPPIPLPLPRPPAIATRTAELPPAP
jgi:membrane-bound lytic murein transglycosylase A